VSKALLVLLLLIVQSATLSADEYPGIKKSRNGICHERGTIHYVQTEYFEAFSTMEECLASGGRKAFAVPDNAPTVTESRGAYSLTASLNLIWIALAIGAVVGAILLVFWWPRYQHRRRLRRLEQQARERWGGHRLEPKGPRKR